MKNKEKETTAEQKNVLRSGRLEVLVTIVGRHKADSYLDLIRTYESNMQISVPAFGTAGTAGSDIATMLGIEDNDRTVIFSVIREDQSPNILSEIGKRFRRVREGKGIAFTLPMSSIIGVALFGFLSNGRPGSGGRGTSGTED